MKAIENLAVVLLERMAVTGAPDLSAIAKKLGLRIKEVDADGFEGTLVRALDGPKGIIAVNSAIPEITRKRFTIGHEIGHYLIPHHRSLKNLCGAQDIERWHAAVASAELEANQFAAELLLPRSLVAPILRLHDPSLHTIRKVAADFSTSLTATVYRFLELTDRPCCMVWSEAGHAKWYVHSDAFTLLLPVTQLPSARSWAARLFAGERAPDDLVEVQSDAWLSRWDTPRVRRVLEHSVAIRSYNAVLSFLEFSLDNDRIDEDDDSPLQSLDPNRYDSRLRRLGGVLARKHAQVPTTLSLSREWEIHDCFIKPVHINDSLDQPAPKTRYARHDPQPPRAHRGRRAIRFS